MDAQTLAEDVVDDVERRRDDAIDDETPRHVAALEPLFAAPNASTLRALAALTPRASDPMAVIRRLGKRATCGDASAPTDADAGRRRHRRRRTRVSDAAHRARWANDGVALLFQRDDDDDDDDDDDAMEIDAPAWFDGVHENDDVRADDGVYGMLSRAARDDREGIELPSQYTIDEVRATSLASSSSFADLARLSEAFSLEDARVGAVANAAALGRGVAHILRDERGIAVGYTLTYENLAPAWERARAATLPPRLAHVYIRPDARSRGLGTALTKWWVSRFAFACAYFAVDAPNASMHRTLSRLECALATTRSGHEASSVHFIAAAATTN